MAAFRACACQLIRTSKCAKGLQYQLRSCSSQQGQGTMASRVSTGTARLEPEPVVTYTDYEESKEEFKYVEKILPRALVPEPPKHDKYPTPSGWVPVLEKSLSLPYAVRRTRFHSYPVYIEIRDGGSRKLTVIRKVEGDIWAAEADLRAFLESKPEAKKVYTQVDEVCCKIRVRGVFHEQVVEWLQEKGL